MYKNSLYFPVVEERQEYTDVPKLPLPPLKDTMDQYIDNLRYITCVIMFFCLCTLPIC